MAYFLDKDVNSQAYEHEHEHMNKSNFLLKYVVHVNMILKKYSLTCRTESLLMWKNILPRVHG
jgi:hypothetical protein